MVEIKINGTKHKVRTSWQEAPASIADSGSLIDEICALSDIPRDLLIKTEPRQLLPLYTLIAFIDDNEAIEQVLIPVQCIEVQTQPYEKMEEAKEAIKTGKPYQKFMRVAKIYYPDENKAVHLLSLGVAIVEQIAVFLENYKEMYGASLSADEEAAGFGRLSDLGTFWTAFNLAGKDILKVDNVLALPAVVVYTALFGLYIENKCQRELVRIKTPNDLQTGSRGNKGRR